MSNTHAAVTAAANDARISTNQADWDAATAAMVPVDPIVALETKVQRQRDHLAAAEAVDPDGPKTARQREHLAAAEAALAEAISTA
jgi:hypothetical protein